MMIVGMKIDICSYKIVDRGRQKGMKYMTQTFFTYQLYGFLFLPSAARAYLSDFNMYMYAYIHPYTYSRDNKIPTSKPF